LILWQHLLVLSVIEPTKLTKTKPNQNRKKIQQYLGNDYQRTLMLTLVEPQNTYFPYTDPSQTSKYVLPILVVTNLLTRHPLDLSLGICVGLRLTADIVSLSHRRADFLTDPALIISP
jgi:hypothetical protein